MSSEPQGDDSRLTHHDHYTTQAEKREYERRKAAIREAIDRGYRSNGMGNEPLLASIQLLASELDLGKSNVDMYRPRAEKLSLPFFHDVAISVLTAVRGESNTRAAARLAAAGDEFEALWQTFVTLETAAAIEGYLPTELEDVQATYGFTTQLGERYVRAESAATGDLHVRDTDDELKSILCAGGKGSGKSAAVETLAMDSYATGHKVVDLVDFIKSENAAYDIPQQDNGQGLLESREEMGLRTGFDDTEAGVAWLEGDETENLVTSPDLEVLAPLSPGLADMDVPTTAAVDKQTVQPFTIPASDLTYRQLVMLLHHTTPTQENHLRSAHQKLRDSEEDWTLLDLARTVRNETNAGEKVSDRIETSLETAQSKSFIRDTDCPHALDWGAVMRDKQTITAFTVHPVREVSDHLVVLSYLIDSLFEARKTLISEQLLSEYPPLTVVMREMHEVAPRGKSEQDSESTIEGYMIDTLGDMFSLTRHADMEIIGDTQKFYRQLDDDISGLFDHIFAFSGHVPDIKKIFKTRLDNTDPAERVAQYSDPGKCAFISENGYRMPIRFAPPRNHHLEAKQDGSGLGFRARVDATPERLMQAPWDADVPERLRFGDIARSDPERFFLMYVTDTGDTDSYVLKDRLTEAYNHWAEATGSRQMSHNPLQQAVQNYFDITDLPDKRVKVNGSRERAHKRLALDYDEDRE